METKTQSLRWLLPLLSALFLLSALTACSSTEDSIEDPTMPQTPINDDDWQVIPIAGGTITKGSISITFPSGTFSKETKVAITEVKKGEIGGEYEASPFYQITLPCNANKPMTLKMKCNEKNGDVAFVAYSAGFCKSAYKEKTIETLLETSFSKGEYSTTIPAFDKNNVDINGSLIVGLGHFINNNSSDTRQTRFDISNLAPWELLHEGKVKNVSYKIIFPWSALVFNGRQRLVQVEIKTKNVNTYVQQALTKFFDMGFKIEGERSLTIEYDNDSNWGGFSENMFNKNWSIINLGIKKILNDDKLEEVTEEDIKCTVTHELFHFIQSDYDKRCQFEKGRPQLDGRYDEDVIMAEMGAVWSEHLLNEGNLNTKWLWKEVLSESFQDKMGLTDITGRWTAPAVKIPYWYWWGEKYEYRVEQYGPRYQNQGYSMAPLLYFLCSTKEMEKYRFKNESVVELYDIWSNYFTNWSQNWSTLDILVEWVYIAHAYDLFIGDKIDEYYLKLLSGKITKGIDIFSYYDYLFGIKDVKKSEKDKYLEKAFDQIPFEGTVYPFGYAFRTIQLKGLKNESLKDKKLVIKQEKEGVQTYLLTANRTDKKYERIGTVATGKDSIVVSGDKLESYRKADGTFDQYFFLVTTRTSNSTSDTGAKPWKVTVELKEDTKEDKFEPRTDITSVDIHWRVCTTGGNWGNDENNNYEIGSMLDLGKDNPIQVAKSGNSISVSGKKKGSSIGVFSCDISYSFNIKLTSKGYGEITDLMMTGSGETTIGKTTIYLYDISLSASNLQFGSMTDTAGTWGLTESEGLKISNFKMKYDSGGDSPTSVSYASDPSNNVWINIGFGN